MLRRALCSLVLFLVIGMGNVAAQDRDSITLVDAKWEKKLIAKNTELVHFHFNQNNLFLANQNISYVEIKNKRNAPAFSFGFDVKELKTTQTFGKENNALVSLNGTFFDIKNGGSVDFIKVDGKVINPNRLDKNGNRAVHQKAAIVIKKGKLSLKKWDQTANWEDQLKEKDVMLSGPLLSFEKQDEFLDTVPFNKLRHPRTAIGIKPNGKVILLTVDGRHQNAAGMSLFELTKIMKWLGCTSSINLDGGGSTTLWVASEPENGVVNYPSDNKKWDHEGTRKVANVILLKSRN